MHFSLSKFYNKPSSLLTSFYCYSIQQINFDLELDPVKLLGGVEVVRSLQDKKKGPKFYVHAKRSPLEAEVSKNVISAFFALSELI